MDRFPYYFFSGNEIKECCKRAHSPTRDIIDITNGVRKRTFHILHGEASMDVSHNFELKYNGNIVKYKEYYKILHSKCYVFFVIWTFMNWLDMWSSLQQVFLVGSCRWVLSRKLCFLCENKYCMCFAHVKDVLDRNNFHTCLQAT